MRIIEILLPKNTQGRDLSSTTLSQIDFLQQRIDGYIDKILDPSTSKAGREFLKLHLKNDYAELKGLLPKFHTVAENSSVNPIEQYEVYDRKTGLTVPKRGPYSSKSRARAVVDKLDNEYGAVRYGYRPIKQLTELFEPNNNWEWTFRGSEERIAHFKVGNFLYRFTASKYYRTKGDWGIEFQISNRDFSGKRFGLSGTGHSAEVFSIVIDIMRDFLSDQSIEIDKLIMTAYENNRYKLYIRMIKRLLPDWGISRSGPDIIVTRPIKNLQESVNKIPLSDKDFESVKELMNKPIPAAIASIYISEVIDDDELNDQISSLEDSEPARDVRPLIVEWINRVMPDQMYRFRDKTDVEMSRGILSPIHGYDPRMYGGSNDPLTGNAFGNL